MYYLEHCLRAGGLGSFGSAVVLRNPGGDEAILRDVLAELQDALPGATITTADAGGTPPPCDLLVALFERPCRFPLHDVIHDSLDQLEGLLRHRDSCRQLLLYRTRWREAELVPAGALPRLLRRRRREARLIRLLERSRLLRRLLRPLYS